MEKEKNEKIKDGEEKDFDILRRKKKLRNRSEAP